MREEIDHGVDFLQACLVQNGAIPERARNFGNALRHVLSDQFENHWDPSMPLKGSGYRCLRNTSGRADPLFRKAVDQSSTHELATLLPELTLWFDPSNVAYRMGEFHGKVQTIYNGNQNNNTASPPINMSPRYPTINEDAQTHTYSPLATSPPFSPQRYQPNTLGVGRDNTNASAFGMWSFNGTASNNTMSMSPPDQVPSYYPSNNGGYHNAVNPLMAR